MHDTTAIPGRSSIASELDREPDSNNIEAGHCYDEVPYAGHPYSQTLPERLATIAWLLGLRSPAPDHCRVLELGCGVGGNLIPIAERFPACQFVGIDASGRQIAEARAISDRLTLKNIVWHHANILDMGADLGEFDYIIVHGVYSWVDERVQSQIMRICSRNLASSGIAYVSYNTYPGWRMRGIIRDVMCYRARAFQSPSDQLHYARELVDFLAHAVPADDAYGMLLRHELSVLKDHDDHYLYHEHLEHVNEPLYFHQFMARAEAEGLRYLGEADFGSMSIQRFSPQVRAVLQAVSSSTEDLEQYMDFVRNRMFRQTLLCHRSVKLDQALAPERLLGLYVASPAQPEAKQLDIRSTNQVVFRGGGAVTSTTDPYVKAALLHLGLIWPKAISFVDLLATIRSQLAPGPAVVDAAQASAYSRRLAEPLLRCYGSRQVELNVLPLMLVPHVSARPTGYRYARMQAETSHVVTTLRHESVRLSDLERHVLPHLDGQHDRGQLLELLAQAVGSGLLAIHEDGKPVADSELIRRMLAEPLESALQRFAQSALLIG